MSTTASDLLAALKLIVASARPSPLAGMNAESTYYLIPAEALDRAREVIAAEEGGTP